MAEFCGLESNDKWINDCGSICCEQKHNIRVSKVMTYPETMDMNYVEFEQVFICYLNERKKVCDFCKKCFDCRRFKLLCGEYSTITELSRREVMIYVTAVRFNAHNLCYSKTQAMTLDILNSRPVDLNFLSEIKEGEEQLHNVIDELRNGKVW